jgi:hypothetical protein
MDTTQILYSAGIIGALLMILNTFNYNYTVAKGFNEWLSYPIERRAKAQTRYDPNAEPATIDDIMYNNYVEDQLSSAIVDHRYSPVDGQIYRGRVDWNVFDVSSL